MNLKQQLTNIAKSAQDAAREMAGISSVTKNKVIKEMALAINRNKNFILEQNKKDIKEARRQGDLKPFIERLTLNEKRIREISSGLLEVSRLTDPVGEVLKAWRRPNGLWIHKVRVPIGVIAIIYESRPNVTADCIGLCLKAGNSVILRGGSEAINSNLGIYEILKGALKKFKVPEGAINMLTTTDRKAIDILLKLNNYIDLVIPRGGEGLISRVVKASCIPVIKHYKGICHIYVDASADLDMARKVCFNAKVQRPATCNAMETMLVDKAIAPRFLPRMLKAFKEAGVEIRGCPITQKMVKGVKRASEKDYHTEYLDLILSVKVVDNLEEAIRHVNYYGSRHSDAIITKDHAHAQAFLKRVDSTCVYLNASTRFTDGYQFGLGAEIGISTDKLHARGPMALEELTTYKYMILGNGQVRR